METPLVLPRKGQSHPRTDWLEHALADVDAELELITNDAQPPFLCRELVEFRDYLADELDEALANELVG